MTHKKQAAGPSKPPSPLITEPEVKRVSNLASEEIRLVQAERRRRMQRYPDLPLVGPKRLADFVTPPLRECLKAA